MNRLWIIIVLAAPFLLGAASGGSGFNNLFADKIIARGRGVEVKASELESIVLSAQVTLSLQGTALDDAGKAALTIKALDDMLMMRLLVAKAKLDEKSTGYLVAKTAYERERNGFLTESAFILQIESRGMGTNAFRDRLYEETLAKKVLEREFYPEIKITDAQVQKYYEQNIAQYAQVEFCRVRQLLLLTYNAELGVEIAADERQKKKELADKLLVRARKGEDFKKLIKEFSEDQGAKESDRELSFGRGQIGPELEKAAFALKNGQTSDVVRTVAGYHILQLIEYAPARTAPLSEVSADIRRGLLEAEVLKRSPDFLKRLKTEAAVEVFLTPR